MEIYGTLTISMDIIKLTRQGGALVGVHGRITIATLRGFTRSEAEKAARIHKDASVCTRGTCYYSWQAEAVSLSDF